LRKKLVALVFILIVVISGVIVWALMPSSGGGGGYGQVWVCDATFDLKATYSDFALTVDQITSHRISDWHVTTSASNWREETNLDLLAMQAQRIEEYGHSLRLPLAAVPGDYPVDLKISFMQGSKTMLTTTHSFTVHMPVDWGVLPFEESWTITGVKAGTYTIQITILSGQYTLSPTNTKQSTYQFDATFTSP
jgi:hypothetical protein